MVRDRDLEGQEVLSLASLSRLSLSPPSFLCLSPLSLSLPSLFPLSHPASLSILSLPDLEEEEVRVRRSP